MQDEVSKTLNTGVSIHFAQYWLPDIRADYHKQYPNINLQIATSQSCILYRQMLDGPRNIQPALLKTASLLSAAPTSSVSVNP